MNTPPRLAGMRNNKHTHTQSHVTFICTRAVSSVSWPWGCPESSPFARPSPPPRVPEADLFIIFSLLPLPMWWHGYAVSRGHNRCLALSLTRQLNVLAAYYARWAGRGGVKLFKSRGIDSARVLLEARRLCLSALCPTPVFCTSNSATQALISMPSLLDGLTFIVEVSSITLLSRAFLFCERHPALH
ncbi:hypothetical protein AB1N83_013866 [Pleurotus pulmonarius]